MGATPIPCVPPPRFLSASRIDRLKRQFALGRIDLDEFEWGVAVLLMYGRGDEQWVPEPGGLPPPKPDDAARGEEVKRRAVSPRPSRLRFVVLRIPGTRLTAAGMQRTRDARRIGMFIETKGDWF